MSSAYVRTQTFAFLAANSAEDVVDLTAQYGELREVLADEGIQPDAPWVGVEFLGNDEQPVALAATNSQGLYRETGAIIIHVVATAGLGVGQAIVTRGEVLRNLFRGSRIGDIIVDSVQPINTGVGATLDFEDGYMSGTFQVAYRRDLNL